MRRFVDVIRRIVRQELAHQRGSALGVVTAIYPHEAEDDENNYEANVRLKHEDIELRRVPLAVGHVGLAAPPRVGDLVLVQYVQGDVNQPVISGRFYHADERPPLHRADDVLFEQRLPDGKLNHLRFASDGTIYIQRDVTQPENNSEALAGIVIDPDGNVEVKVGPSILITLTNDDNIEITADGQPITVNCDTLTIHGNVTVDGTMDISDNTTIETQLTVGTSPQTVITGGQIEGR
jgi:uncharacterized protein involved in type VI secretion and phage assembly